jgi:hypothetical protein
MSTPIQKPHEKMPEHLSTAKPCLTKDEKMDAQMADSFPASDPPSYSGGNIGAPTDRESQTPSPDHPAVLEAEKKVKHGDAAVPHKY